MLLTIPLQMAEINTVTYFFHNKEKKEWTIKMLSGGEEEPISWGNILYGVHVYNIPEKTNL